MQDKKHILKFSHGDREVSMETDDLSDLSRQPWFSNFLEVPYQLPDTFKEPKVTREDKEKLEKAAKEKSALYRKLEEMNEMLAEAKMMNRQLEKELEAERELSTKKEPEDLAETLKAASDEMSQLNPPEEAKPQPQPSQPAQPQVAPGVRPGPTGQMTRQKLPPSTYLEITQEQMTKGVWDSLTPEQQREWMVKHNIQTS